MQRIIIDMDEVIADPMNAMIDWYRQETGGDVDRSKMKGSWLKGFPEPHQPMIWDRLRAPGFFRNLPVMEDSIEVLEAINERYDLFIVSAATEFPNSLKDKYDWLAEHFPFIGWKQLVLCGDKRVVYGDFMIDDHVRHLQHFTGKPYLFTAAHNLDVTGYDRLNSWKEAKNIFLS